VFGSNGKRIMGKKILRGKNEALICDVDEFGNIIPESCQPVIAEEEIDVEAFSIPKPRLPRK